jgi:hypothetical protein
MATTIKEIHVEQLQKLLDHGSVGYVLQLNVVTTGPKDTDAVFPQLESILQQYSDVFSEPSSLPPHRQCDHSIPLTAGATPPMVGPYRVPHKQKDEMEAQIKQLLESKVIRNSQSPYTSPTILVRKMGLGDCV